MDLFKHSIFIYHTYATGNCSIFTNRILQNKTSHSHLHLICCLCVRNQVIMEKLKRMKYKLSILKSDGGNADSVERFFFEYDQPVAGEGRFIHTYRCDGSPIPSFAGEPEHVRLMGDIDTFTRMVWNSLNEDNKVSLFVRYIDLATGKTQDRIVNKYEKV